MVYKFKISRYFGSKYLIGFQPSSFPFGQPMVSTSDLYGSVGENQYFPHFGVPPPSSTEMSLPCMGNTKEKNKKQARVWRGRVAGVGESQTGSSLPKSIRNFTSAIRISKKFDTGFERTAILSCKYKGHPKLLNLSQAPLLLLMLLLLLLQIRAAVKVVRSSEQTHTQSRGHFWSKIMRDLTETIFEIRLVNCAKIMNR